MHWYLSRLFPWNVNIRYFLVSNGEQKYQVHYLTLSVVWYSKSQHSDILCYCLHRITQTYEHLQCLKLNLLLQEDLLTCLVWGESRCLELLILSVNLQRPVPSEAFYILPRDATIHPIWKMSTGKQSTISPEERKWMKLIITAPLTFNELLHFEDKASLKLSFPGGRFPLTWMSMSRILPHTATGSKKKVC